MAPGGCHPNWHESVKLNAGYHPAMFEHSHRENANVELSATANLMSWQKGPDKHSSLHRLRCVSSR